MAKILHLLTRPNDTIASEIIARQKEAGHDVQVFDLTGDDPDYPDIVNSIFQAESIQTW